MQSTHEEARRLIQFKADGRLDPVSEEVLRTHLAACADCRTYLESVKETESVLRQTLRKQWSAHPLPLSMDAVLEKSHSRRGGIFLTTRTALIGIASMLFAFFAWQSLTAVITPPQNLPATIPFIPTPSVQYQFTVTGTVQEDCGEIRYIAQEGDTLGSIARQFSVSTEAIISANGLTDASISPNQELVIPVCELPSTGTVQPPTFTITPIFETVPTTPG